MTTKRKPVKKAAKKVVKKPLTMKELDNRIEDLYARNDNRMNDINALSIRQDKDWTTFNNRTHEMSRQLVVHKGENDLRRAETTDLSFRIDGLERDLKKTDDYYHNLIEDNVLERLVKAENRIKWTRFWLAITVISFAAYMIITA